MGYFYSLKFEKLKKQYHKAMWKPIIELPLDRGLFHVPDQPRKLKQSTASLPFGEVAKYLFLSSEPFSEIVRPRCFV